MKVVILAGGYGTRITEESQFKPKPMIELGGMPMLWHIMKIYSSFGFNDFIVCAGYKHQYISDWFTNHFFNNENISFDPAEGKKVMSYRPDAEPWKVTVVNTGLETQTGGRVKKIKKYIGNEPFMLTYGDAVGDVNIPELLKFHEQSGKIATVSVYNFAQNKGVLDVAPDGKVNAFREKSDLDGDLINIGFMVFQPEFLDYIADDATVLEKEPFEGLVRDNQMMAYTHMGYWQCMDTLREKQKLEQLWESGEAPWKIWND